MRTIRGDAALADELWKQGDEHARAMSVEDLAASLSIRSANSLADNYWLRAMGLNDRSNNTAYHDNRLWPSPLIFPVRMGVHDRRMGFRLRLGPPLDPGIEARSRPGLATGSNLDELVDQTPETSRNFRRFADQDEL